MKYSHKIVVALVIIALVFVVFAVKSSRAPGAPEQPRTSITAAPTPTANADTLEKNDVDALYDAIQDEYKAEAMYLAVTTAFGNVKPFSNIIKAEERHSQAIARVLEAYGVPVPTPIQAKPTVPESVVATCIEGVRAEKANIALYQSWLQTVKNPDVRQVMNANSDASEFRHLPAFQQCAN